MIYQLYTKQQFLETEHAKSSVLAEKYFDFLDSNIKIGQFVCNIKKPDILMCRRLKKPFSVWNDLYKKAIRQVIFELPYDNGLFYYTFNRAIKIFKNTIEFYWEEVRVSSYKLDKYTINDLANETKGRIKMKGFHCG